MKDKRMQSDFIPPEGTAIILDKEISWYFQVISVKSALGIIRMEEMLTLLKSYFTKEFC